MFACSDLSDQATASSSHQVNGYGRHALTGSARRGHLVVFSPIRVHRHRSDPASAPPPPPPYTPGPTRRAGHRARREHLSEAAGPYRREHRRRLSLLPRRSRLPATPRRGAIPPLRARRHPASHRPSPNRGRADTPARADGPLPDPLTTTPVPASQLIQVAKSSLLPRSAITYRASTGDRSR